MKEEMKYIQNNVTISLVTTSLKLLIKNKKVKN